MADLLAASRLERAIDLPGLARTVRRSARRQVERTLHAGRRRLARHALARRWMPQQVLFLCHGNVCRSPYAAAVFARAVAAGSPTPLHVASAGFIGPDRAPPALALHAAERRGIDLRAHRSSLIRGDHVRAADVIVVMSAEQARAIHRRLAPARDGAPRPVVVVLGDLDPLPIEERAIHDPWDGGAEAFDASYERIDRCVRELAHLLIHGDAP